MKRLFIFLFLALSSFHGTVYAQELSLEERVSQLEKTVNQLILINYKMAKKIKKIENYLGISREDKLLGMEGIKTKKGKSSSGKTSKTSIFSKVAGEIEGPVIVATLVHPKETLKKWIDSGFLSVLEKEIPQARFFVSLKRNYVVIFLPKGEKVAVKTLTSLGFPPPYLKVKKLSVKGKPLSSLESLFSQFQQEKGGVRSE